MIIATAPGKAIVMTGASTTYMYIETDNDIFQRNWNKAGFAEYDGELYSISLVEENHSIAFWKPEELQVPRPVRKYDLVVSTDGKTWTVDFVSRTGDIMFKADGECARTLCHNDIQGAEYFNIVYR